MATHLSRSVLSPACKLFTIFATSSGCFPQCAARNHRKTVVPQTEGKGQENDRLRHRFDIEPSIFFSLRVDPSNPDPLPKDQRKSDPAYLNAAKELFTPELFPKQIPSFNVETKVIGMSLVQHPSRQLRALYRATACIYLYI